jgi:hypothetical protein
VKRKPSSPPNPTRKRSHTYDCDPVADETSSSACSAILRTSAAWPCAKDKRTDNPHVGWLSSVHFVECKPSLNLPVKNCAIFCSLAAPRKKIAAHNDMIGFDAIQKQASLVDRADRTVSALSACSPH